MAFNNTVTIIGNVTRDPELRYIPNGTAVTNFGLAWNLRKQNGEEEAMFFNVTCWRSLAENVAESIGKGARVIVTGRLDYRSYETQEGDKRNVVEIQAEEIGPSLQWATADVERNARTDGGGSAAPSSTGGQVAPTHPTDEEPF
ncbi:MAG: single-stranded DNA-binding protein [Actinomycetota bacterium]|nr:single-stranded DNA-binding protein [Actinomycetota bacterium]MEE3354333.1 single-stranded DNA-binding protein [Actinomycetota bacterium]